MRNFFNRLGDRINPIVVKEMRQAVNSKLVSFVFIVFLVVELIVMAIIILTQVQDEDSALLNFRTGREVFMILQGILMVSCMMLIPGLTGGRLVAERSDVNVDLLFISSLSPRAIMAGKLLAAIALTILIFSACAPFMTFAYLLRGLEISTIFLTLATNFLAVLVGTMFILLVAAIPATRVFRLVLGILGYLLLVIFSLWVQGLSWLFLRRDFIWEWQSGDFWLALSGIVGVTLGFIGLMFVWATALISPPTSNRILPVRIYTLGFWAFLALVCGLWFWKTEEFGPMVIWGYIGVCLFSFHMLVASSERDQLGPRVLRRIPQSLYLRPPAFLLFSGASGGFAYSYLGALASLAGIYLLSVMPSWERYASDHRSIQIAFLVVAYVYCYSMTAVLVRRLLHATAFKSSGTWLIAIIIFGLGSLLPYLAYSAFFPKRHGYIYDYETIWLFLPSAAVMIDEELTNRGTSFFNMTVLFLGGWGAAATVLNATWLLRQVRDFRPPRRNELKTLTGEKT